MSVYIVRHDVVLSIRFGQSSSVSYTNVRLYSVQNRSIVGRPTCAQGRSEALVETVDVISNRRRG